MKPILTILSTFFLFISCSLLAANSTTVITEQDAIKALISDISVRNFARVEALSQKNIRIQSSALSLSLLRHQPLLNNGTRSEVSVDYPFLEHDTVSYEWEMMLPTGFKHDAPQNRWWAMSQWHVQPDRTKNESWDDYPNEPPSIALYFGYIDGHYYLSTHYMDVQPEVDNLIEIELGKWTKIKAEITWSQAENGKMKLWLNDSKTPHFTYYGANMLNTYQHYFKVGMYRHPEITTENTIHLRALHVSK